MPSTTYFDFLLLETDDYLLQEDGLGKIILNQYTIFEGDVTVTLQSKSHEPRLTVSVEEPLWYDNRAEQYRFTQEIESYQHTLGADGGYVSCTFLLKVSQKTIDEWLERALARHVVAYAGETEVVFEGFINKVSFGIGALSAERGPLFDISNRDMVVYTPIIDVTVDPPVTGSATETPIAEDTDSQERYGIIEKISSGGQRLDDGTTDEAEEIRDLYLEETKLPYTDEAINLGQMSEPTMTVECLGYAEWFKAYAYNDFTASTVTYVDQIKNVVNADPNNIFSADQSDIEDNLALTNELEDTNQFANSIIKKIVAQGDASNTRWIFGVGRDRKVYYKAIPSQIDYLHSLTSSSQNITLVDQTAIMPWNVKPGTWIEITDFLISQSGYPSESLRQNPRVMFAESVTFTAPNTLSVTGGRISTVKQRLAQLGVGAS
jgi:hypothetical protein